MDNPPDNGPCEVTVTAPDREWLSAFVRRLVETHIAAAAHVDSMATTYYWGGEVHDTSEARAILHTSFSRVSDIVNRVREVHPYEVACVAAVPITAGSPQYLSWISSTVADET